MVGGLTDAMQTFRRSPRRLSLRHGAAPAEIRAYMADLFHELQTSRLAGYPLSADGWKRRAAGAPRLQDCYKIGRELGRGHFGVVRECADVRTGELFACKSILKDQINRSEDLKELRAEVLIPLLLQEDETHSRAATSHAGEPDAGGAFFRVAPNAGIVRLLEIAEDESAVHLIVEHCAGGDLFDHVARSSRLPEREAAGIFRQVVSAVLRIHARGIVHRDLKPENILLLRPPSATCASATLATTGSAAPPTSSAAQPASADACSEVRVGDFGLAQKLTPARPQLRGLVGSPFYMAPEIVRGKEYGRAVDVWSLGVVLYTCLSGVLPFYGKNHNAVFAAACRADPDMSRRPWSLISPEAKDLVRSMLQADPARRIRLKDVLNHPWLRLADCQTTYRSFQKREIPSSVFPASISRPPVSRAAVSAPKSAPIPIPQPPSASIHANSTGHKFALVTPATTTSDHRTSAAQFTSPGSSGSSFSIVHSTSISSSRSSSDNSNCSNISNPAAATTAALPVRQNTIKPLSADSQKFPSAGPHVPSSPISPLSAVIVSPPPSPSPPPPTPAVTPSPPLMRQSPPTVTPPSITPVAEATSIATQFLVHARNNAGSKPSEPHVVTTPDTSDSSNTSSSSSSSHTTTVSSSWSIWDGVPPVTPLLDFDKNNLPLGSIALEAFARPVFPRVEGPGPIQASIQRRRVY